MQYTEYHYIQYMSGCMVALSNNFTILSKSMIAQRNGETVVSNELMVLSNELVVLSHVLTGFSYSLA